MATRSLPTHFVQLLAFLSLPDGAPQAHQLSHVQALLQQPEFIDQHQLLSLIARHKIMHCAHTKLAALDYPHLHEIVDVLAQRKVKSTFRQMHLLRQFDRICKAFTNEGVIFRPIKGFGLSKQLYPDAYCREIRDIDIWVPQSQLKQAHAVLLNLAVTLKKPNCIDIYDGISNRYKDLTYVIPGGHVLELHTRLLNARTCFSNYLNEVLLTRPLNPSEQFVYLCIHGVKPSFYRLRWLTDLYLLANAPNAPLNEAIGLAHEHRVEKNLWTALQVIQRILGQQETLTSAIQKDNKPRQQMSVSLATTLCVNVLHDAPLQPGNRLTLTNYTLDMLCQRGWHDRMKFFDFFFGPSAVHDPTTNPNSIQHRTTVFCKRLRKFVQSEQVTRKRE